ncbi:MAG: alpha/beta hydrolase [Kiritimatiellia bacterium]
MKRIQGHLTGAKTHPQPEITCWLPDTNPTGAAIVILPGGGYAALAPHEGQGYAEYFSQAGVACFVTKYRLGSGTHHHPAMLEDALAAIATIRTHANDFGIDPDKIGIMGSSAGGHLAAHTLVAWNRYQTNVSLRPSFGILCYPVIASSGPYAHAGSMQNLLGASPTPSALTEVACEKHVTPDTPPCFLWHTVEDQAVPVENSLLFAQALRQHGVPFELHIYPDGRHGLGLDTPFDWASPCLHWLQSAFPQ